MDNASIILQTLDRHLDHPVRLILYGRAALQFGFDNPPTGTAQSRNVDGIVPFSDLEALTRDDGCDGNRLRNAVLQPREGHAQAEQSSRVRSIPVWFPRISKMANSGLR